MKRLTAILVIAAFLTSISLTGCGSDSSDEKTTTTKAAITSTPSTVAGATTAAPTSSTVAASASGEKSCGTVKVLEGTLELKIVKGTASCETARSVSAAFDRGGTNGEYLGWACYIGGKDSSDAFHCGKNNSPSQSVQEAPDYFTVG